MTIEDMLDRKRELGLSYEMISQLSGVPVGTVQKVLGGFTKSPRYETLAALERVLGEPQRPSGESNKVYRTFAEWEAEHPGPDCVREKITYGIDGTAALTGKGRKKQGTYTVEDYLNLPDDQRYELIDGALYGMAAPTVRHQQILGELHLQIGSYIKNKKGPCKVLFAPVDVQLNEDNSTMLQPDLIILCDPEKTENGKRVFGAPDFVVEILSDSTASRDLTLKLYKYRDAGVREYWMVDPKNQRVVAHDFSTGISRIYRFTDRIPVQIYGGECEVDLSEYADFADFVAFADEGEMT